MLISFLIIAVSFSCPSSGDICTVTGPVTDSLIQVLPRNATTYETLGQLFVNRVFLKQSENPRADADSALAYFTQAQRIDSSATLAAYMCVAHALRAREDGFFSKLTGVTSGKVRVIFATADSLTRAHPCNYSVLFLVGNLFAEADPRLNGHKYYWQRAQELFRALELYADAAKSVDPLQATNFFNEEILGTVLLTQGKLTLKLAVQPEDSLPAARAQWEKVVDLFPQSSAADNARIQLEKYKL